MEFLKKLTRKRIALLAVGLIILAGAAWAVSPYFITTNQQEATPGDYTTVVKAGTWVGRGDGIHSGSGNVKILTNDQGIYILRLENFSVTNGPDVHFFLSPERDVTAGSVDLGKVTGTQGNYNVAIPQGTDVTAMRYALVYCVPFKVLFARAALQ